MHTKFTGQDQFLLSFLYKLLIMEYFSGGVDTSYNSISGYESAVHQSLKTDYDFPVNNFVVNPKPVAKRTVPRILQKPTVLNSTIQTNNLMFQTTNQNIPPASVYQSSNVPYNVLSNQVPRKPVKLVYNGAIPSFNHMAVKRPYTNFRRIAVKQNLSSGFSNNETRNTVCLKSSISANFPDESGRNCNLQNLQPTSSPNSTVSLLVCKTCKRAFDNHMYFDDHLIIHKNIGLKDFWSSFNPYE